jgi:hypothetical protein
MSASPASTDAPAKNIDPPPLEIDLRDPYFAALLAWLWPGAGHIYQRRYAKAALFMVCILGTYFFGLALGEGKVVYAAWNRSEKRWQFIPQVAVGLPAAPALAQAVVRRGRAEPLFGGFMAGPQPADGRRQVGESPENYEQRINQERAAMLSRWHNDLNIRFELGTLYTMIAGLLNVLAIWDAYGGPVVSEPGEKKERGPPKKA